MASKFWIFLALFGLTGSISLAFSTNKKLLDINGNEDSVSSGSNNCAEKSVTWHGDACCTRKCEKGWKKLPVLVVSMDSFRAEYLMRSRTSSIQRLIDCGSHAPYMYPSYPAKTFPNHYAVATGLYPESNGIIDNNMYDPNMKPPSFSMSDHTNAKWWNGEPIWNTVTANGGKSASCFWPGSDVKIQGRYPTYWYPYNKTAPTTHCIDSAISWLQMSDNKRPSIITIYMDQPDEEGHEFGPLSDQVSSELVIVDGLINYLMNKLYDNNLFHCVNKILLADHGMEQINISSYISLSDYFPTSEPGMHIFSGPVARVQLVNSNYTADEVINSTRCKDNRFRVYRRLETPKRLHYSAISRIGDAVFDSNPTIEIFKGKPPQNRLLGDHGYDYKDSSMHALFVAQGPAFKQNYTVDPFQNVEIYNLLADLLEVKNRAPTNGTAGTLHDILTKPPATPSRSQLISPKECETSTPTQNCGDCKDIGDSCVQPKLFAKTSSKRADSWCSLIKRSIIYDGPIQNPVAVQSLISDQTELKIDQTCSIFQPLQNGNISGCDDIDFIIKSLATRDASIYPLQPFNSGKNTCAADWYNKAALYNGFYSDGWSSLQKVTLNYAKQFGNLIIISGTIFDYDGNGVADPYDVIEKYASETFENFTVSFPSHVYQILIRCDSKWTEEGKCAGRSSAISFILPNEPVPANCQTLENYLFMYTARIRDIELLTGLEFFTDWPFEEAVKLRTHVNQDLW